MRVGTYMESFLYNRASYFCPYAIVEIKPSKKKKRRSKSKMRERIRTTRTLVCSSLALKATTI